MDLLRDFVVLHPTFKQPHGHKQHEKLSEKLKTPEPASTFQYSASSYLKTLLPQASMCSKKKSPKRTILDNLASHGLVAQRNDPDKSIEQQTTAMHHHHQSIKKVLFLSEHGPFPLVWSSFNRGPQKNTNTDRERRTNTEGQIDSRICEHVCLHQSSSLCLLRRHAAISPTAPEAAHHFA